MKPVGRGRNAVARLYAGIAYQQRFSVAVLVGDDTVPYKGVETSVFRIYLGSDGDISLEIFSQDLRDDAVLTVGADIVEDVFGRCRHKMDFGRFGRYFRTWNTVEDGIFPFFLKNDVQAENTVVSAPDVHISVDIIRHPAAAADAGQCR